MMEGRCLGLVVITSRPVASDFRYVGKQKDR